MSGYSSGDGQSSEAIRQNVRSCRKALRAKNLEDGVALSDAVVAVFSIETDSLPSELRYELLEVRKLLLGDALLPDTHLDSQEEFIRRLVAALALSDKMRVSQAVLSFCSRFDHKLKCQMGDGKA